MTWDRLIKKARTGLSEAGSHGVAVERAVVKIAATNEGPSEAETLCLIQDLALGLSHLHSACEELLTGLDALAIAMRGYMTDEDPKIH